MNTPDQRPPMETPILDRLARDFGNHGARAAQFLKTAEMLIGSPPSAPRIGEVIAYCIREALIEVPRAAGSAEAESTDRPWRLLSREVVDAATRYKQARGLTGMDEQQALEDLLESISELDDLHSRDNVHTEGLRDIIKFRTGLSPLTRNINAFTEYQRLIDDVQTMVHTSANAELITVDYVEPYFRRTIEVLSSLFSVDSRMEQIQHLATLEQPSSTDVATLRTHLITPHDQSFFASFVNSPAWLDLMTDHGLLDPPENGGERWLAAMMINRLRDRYGRYIADWLGRAWNRWSSTEQGISSLADAAFQAEEYGRETLILCLKRKPNVPEICNLSFLGLRRIESSHPHVETFADLLLNPAAALDQHFERDVLDSLVEGTKSENCISRIRILKHKLCTRMESDLPFYTSDSSTITSVSDDISYDFKSSWKFLSALIQALRKAIALDSALVNLLDEIKGLPEEVGNRIQAWLRTNAKDTECQESIEFIAQAIQTRRPTTDDVLLVDSINDRCGLGSTVSLWQEALGSPPDPVSLGTITRQDRVPDDLIRLWYWSVVLPTEVAGSWRNAQAILSAAHGRVERDSWLRPPPRPTVRSGPNSPFDEADLESMAPEEAADLIAAWRPNEADSWEMRSPRGIGRQLEKIAGRNPRRWTNSPVEMVARLKHPTYIAHFFRGLVVGIEELRDTASLIIEAIVFVRTHPWPVEPLGHDYFDADTDWSETDRAGIDLINALARQHLPLDAIATKSLSQNPACYRQAGSVDDQKAGIVEQPQVVRSALLVADFQLAEAIMPAIGAFHDPAPRRKALARGWRWGIQAPLRGMHRVALRRGRGPGFRIIEPFVPAQVLRRRRGGDGPLHDYARQGGCRHLHVVPVGGADHHAQGQPPPITQHVPFGAQLAPVGRIRPGRVAPEGGTAPSRCRQLASPTRCRAPGRSAAIDRARGGPRCHRPPTAESAGGRWSQSRTPEAPPATDSRSARHAGCHPGPGGGGWRATPACPAVLPGAATVDIPPTTHRAGTGSSAPRRDHSDSPSSASSLPRAEEATNSVRVLG